MTTRTDLLTTADAAKMLGVSTRRVRALAAARGVGQQVTRGVWIFTPQEISLLTPGPSGKHRLPTIPT
jgi:hypothetical protein